jgi:Flp pilus assembly pilin Flp
VQRPRRRKETAEPKSGDTTHPHVHDNGTSLLELGPSQDIAAAKEVNEMQKIRNLFAEFPRREEGQTMAEYGVVLAVITIAVFGALALLSKNITGAITRVAGYIT